MPSSVPSGRTAPHEELLFPAVERVLDGADDRPEDAAEDHRGPLRILQGVLVDDPDDGVVDRDEPRIVEERGLAGRLPRDEIAGRSLRRGVGGDERIAVVLQVGRERPDDQELEPLHRVGLHRRDERADDPPNFIRALASSAELLEEAARRAERFPDGRIGVAG